MHGKETKQQSEWAGEMGNSYVERNPHSIDEGEMLYTKDYAVTRRVMNEEFLSAIDRTSPILEIGANVGLQLAYLKDMGFEQLLGIDINAHAVLEAKKYNPQVDIIRGSGFGTPFKDQWFDLVFTSGVLIHISPTDIAAIMTETYRLSKRYIWGFEYYAPQYTALDYRGQSDLLWKTDFCMLFTDTFQNLRVVHEKKYPMTDGKNVSQMYLLEKAS